MGGGTALAISPTAGGVGKERGGGGASVVIWSAFLFNRTGVPNAVTTGQHWITPKA